MRGGAGGLKPCMRITPGLVSTDCRESIWARSSRVASSSQRNNWLGRSQSIPPRRRALSRCAATRTSWWVIAVSTSRFTPRRPSVGRVPDGRSRPDAGAAPPFAAAVTRSRGLQRAPCCVSVGDDQMRRAACSDPPGAAPLDVMPAAPGLPEFGKRPRCLELMVDPACGRLSCAAGRRPASLRARWTLPRVPLWFIGYARPTLQAWCVSACLAVCFVRDGWPARRAT